MEQHSLSPDLLELIKALFLLLSNLESQLNQSQWDLIQELLTLLSLQPIIPHHLQLQVSLMFSNTEMELAHMLDITTKTKSALVLMPLIFLMLDKRPLLVLQFNAATHNLSSLQLLMPHHCHTKEQLVSVKAKTSMEPHSFQLLETNGVPLLELCQTKPPPYKSELSTKLL
jgi:hypothetical protein